MALHASGQTAAAIKVLERLDHQRPGDIDILSALVSYHHEIGERGKTLDYVRQLLKQVPDNPSTQALARQLEFSADASPPDPPRAAGQSR